MDRLTDRLSAFRNDTKENIDELVHRLKLNELYEKQMEDDKMKKTILTILAAIGIVASVAAIAFAVYRLVKPDYLDDYDDDYDDDFDDDAVAEALSDDEEE